MRGYRDDIVVATHILAQAGRMAPVAQRRLNRFVSSVSKAYLKSKDTRLSDIVLFYEAVGKANFLTIVGGFTAKEAADLLSRVDPRHAGEAKADPAWAKMRLTAVLTGDEEPARSDTPKTRGRVIRRSKAAPRAPRSVMHETDAFSARRKAGVAATGGETGSFRHPA